MNADESEALVQYARILLGRRVPDGGERQEACEEQIAVAQALVAAGLSLELALELFDRARTIADAAGLEAHSVVASASTSEALIRLQRPRAALERADEAVARSETLPTELHAGALHARARAHDALGDLDLARADLEAAQLLEPENPARWMLLAQLAVSNQQWDEARAAFGHAIDAASSSGDLNVIPQAMWELAELNRLLGNIAEARKGLEEARELAGSIGDVSGTAYPELALAELDLEAGDFTRARTRYAHVRALAELLAERENAAVTIESAPSPSEAVSDAFVDLAAPHGDAPVLRLAFSQSLGERVQVELWPGSAEAPSRCLAPFRFAVDPRMTERLRWYAEDFLERPLDPAPAIAADVEDDLTRVGEALFAGLFRGAEAGAIASAAFAQLDRLRIEVVADTLPADNLPWELLRDPDSGADLALGARALTRTTTHATSAPATDGRQDRVRMLLVICRPGGRRDVPFRSVAGPLVRELASRGSTIDVEVLRPPTFTRLQDVLRQADAEGRPFDLVHFDGHGVFDAARRRSYLLFEGDDPGGIRVTGKLLGEQLAASGVVMLVMHACRSALGHQDQAYGSIARELLESGVPGVVAMRFNVYVTTASKFVVELYRELASGLDLADAVTRARRSLTNPDRTHGVRDWFVPAVYEAVATRLSPSRDNPPSPAREVGLPAGPAHGFVGRDEVFVELERALAQGPHVQLDAFGGAGKTTAAVEFARWYVATGGCGCAGPHINLRDCESTDAVVERVAKILAPASASDGPDARTCLLQAVERRRPLMVWDDAGPPVAALADLLKEIADRGGRVILIPHRPGDQWPDVPVLRMPNMPFAESLELAFAVAGGTGSPDMWAPLLHATYGNPLAVETATHEVRRQKLSTSAEVAELVRGLRVHEPGAGAPTWTEPLTRILDVTAAPPEVTLLSQFHGYVTAFGFTALWARDPDPDEAARVLDDMASLGLLTQVSPGVYAIHPGLPSALVSRGAVEPAGQRFVEAMASIGSGYLALAEQEGARPPWQAEEKNLLAARRLATDNGWWRLAAELINVLYGMYLRQGRPLDWREQFIDAAPHFVDLETGDARPGFEWAWSDFNGFLSGLAEQEGDFTRAARLRAADVGRRRTEAQEALTRSAEDWTEDQRRLVRRLATALTNLGPLQTESRDPAAHDTLTEAVHLAHVLGDWRLEALARLNLGVMYMVLPESPEFDLADQQFAAGYELTIAGDPALAGQLLTERGTVHYEHALASEGETERVELERAAQHFQRASELRPQDAVLNHQLGLVFRRLGVIDQCRAHFERAIALREASDQPLDAADTRLNLAYALEDAGFLDEALSFAETAVQQSATSPVRRESLELEAERTAARLALSARS